MNRPQSQVQLSQRRQLRTRDGRAFGFTLIEASLSMLIMSLLLLGSIDLFVGALRATADSSALIDANLDAANALQTMVQTTREAYYFELPDESTFTPPSGTTAGSYETTMSVGSASETICSAMLITMPNRANTTNVNYDSATNQTVPLYSRDQGVNGLLGGQQILYYRADLPSTPPPYTTPAVPDAANGNCLWELTVSDNDGSSPTFNGPIIKSIAYNPAGTATYPNAVQFVRPQSTPNAQGVTTDIPYEVEVKVICSYYAPNGGAASNEVSNTISTGGQLTTSLDGKCVFLRDHELGSTYESGSTNPVNNKFEP